MGVRWNDSPARRSVPRPASPGVLVGLRGALARRSPAPSVQAAPVGAPAPAGAPISLAPLFAVLLRESGDASDLRRHEAYRAGLARAADRARLIVADAD